MRLKRLSPADKDLEPNGARSIRLTKLKRPSPAIKADEVNG